ncbi:MAG TPA: hypothetical protein VK480_05795 [Solirubrobacterales bacterium]|nr:hypothetical protein [Solirubrobacterales bacterium]
MSSAQGEENEFFAGLSLVLPDRELRVTKRCLIEDLDGAKDANLEDVSKHPIVRAFIRERRDKTTGTRTVNQLSSGKEIWVLAQAQRHRGGTWFEAKRDIVWLVAAGHHESGSKDDFFPYCRQLDREGRLAPSKDDYKALFLDQRERLAARILIDAPLLRKRARESDSEISGQIGGKFGVNLAIEVVDEIEEITVAFDLRTLENPRYMWAILAALEADGEWEPAERMPSRSLEPHESAFRHMGLNE